MNTTAAETVAAGQDQENRLGLFIEGQHLVGHHLGHVRIDPGLPNLRRFRWSFCPSRRVEQLSSTAPAVSPRVSSALA